ncbi:MAG: DUF4114 domain-containing protein [Bacteroidota bacterium]
MKAQYYHYILLGMACMLTAGCSITHDHDDIEASESVEITNDANELSGRTTFINKPLIVSRSGEATLFDPMAQKNEGLSAQSEQDLEHTWYYVAEVSAPEVQGEQLSATHVQVVDDKAYVSYNRQGDLHYGGLEVFDLSNKAYPKLISQALFEYADVNAITTDYEGSSLNRNIWLALSHKNKGAVLRQIQLKDGLISDEIRDVSLSKYTDTGISASANGVVRFGDYIYITAGKSHGGTFLFREGQLQFVEADQYQNAKYVAVNGNNPNTSYVVSLVTGDEAMLKVKAVGSTSEADEIQLGEAIHQNVEFTYKGKATLHFSERYPEVVFVTMGSEGLKGIDILTRQVLFSSSDRMLTTGNTNGVTSDEDYVYMANGADGLAVALMPEQAGDMETVFNWDLDDTPGSANFITTNGEWIFVAKGKEGLKILRKGETGEHQTLYGHDEKGVPHGMKPDDVEVCSELLPNLFANVLPERSNVLQRNPEYFDNPTREIELLKNDKVYVTFVNEGAGYLNSLGYFYYHKDNPPQRVEDLNKVVIFPNASAKYSGGELVQGNTMKLLGEFEAGTVIGFYVISNGWNGKKITNGIYSQYTIPEFNVSARQQSILFYDQGCSSIVMAFEDIALPQGDKDFNDVIFLISTEDPASIDTTQFIQQ